MHPTIISHILVPVDNSACAGRAVEFAAGLARPLQAKLTLLHIVTEPGSLRTPPELKQYAELEHVEITEHSLTTAHAQRLLELSAQQARDGGAPDVHTALGEGRAAATILDYANANGVDLIVRRQTRAGKCRRVTARQRVAENPSPQRVSLPVDPLSGPHRTAARRRAERKARHFTAPIGAP